MTFEETTLPGVVLVTPKVHGDERGFFLETWREDRYAELTGAGAGFCQDNHSRSRRGVLRGLHFQTRRPQGKLLRCVRGEIFDVAVDVRPGSEHFGRWVGVRLNEKTNNRLFVPAGFAHGFQVLSDTADVEYKCTDYYDPAGESGVRWNDPDLAIAWPLAEPLVSEKDQVLPLLAELPS